MTSRLYAAQGRSIAGRTVAVLVVAGAAFIAGGLSQSPISFRDVSTAFAQPARAAQGSLREVMPAPRTIAPARADGWGRSEGEQIYDPRECDLARGISTACLFMD